MSTATEFECLFGMFQWKNLLNERSQFVIVDHLSDLREALAIGLDTNHHSAYAAFPCEVLPRLLQQRHENPAFFEDSERSPVRISAQRIKHNIHVVNVIFKAIRLVVDRFVGAEFSDQIEMIGAGSSADHA